MNPFTPPFVPGFFHTQSQEMASQHAYHSNTHPLATNTVFAGSHLHLAKPTNPMFAYPSEQAQFVSPNFQPVTHLPFRPPQLDIISPTSHRVGPSLLPQLDNFDNQNIGEHIQGLPILGTDADKVTEPSEMPIGSLVHLKEPPKWGVVKISNVRRAATYTTVLLTRLEIPYSITKQEIFQFLGRQSRLIAADKGCPIHIIMERSTAKTMDCYAEFASSADAKETVNRINRIYETGRAPRLGNRHVDVELSSQDSLLKDLFPRAKCVVWESGMPFALPNSDPYSTGFTGFFTSEEIIGAIRHAEIAHRVSSSPFSPDIETELTVFYKSPFCDKCPQRTYESTISTLYKFPWYATELYTIHDRNQLFELANRHIISLVARIKRSNTVGLDQKLLIDLLRAGLNCPSFNERQKYTLCINSEEISEITKFPEIGKWFPFDTLVKMPKLDEARHLYYAHLISNGTVPDTRGLELPNNFPMDNSHLYSPYGRVWFEWPLPATGSYTWENAVHHEMTILTHLVRSGWTSSSKAAIAKSASVADKTAIRTDSNSHGDILTAPLRRASESTNCGSPIFNNAGSCWNQKLLLYPSTKGHAGYLGHRITQSSPNCLPSSRDQQI